MKKINLLLAFTIPLILISLSSCNVNCKRGSGKQVSETRGTDQFSQIDISGGYKVIIRQDSSSSLKITADDNLMQYIKSDVGGGKLTIHSSRNICSSAPFVVNISFKKLSCIKASGAVDIVSDGKLTVKDLELQLAGATKLTLDLNADNVSTNGSGLTDINLTGQASTHTVELSGSGSLNALNFVVAKYRIESSGISHCKINVLNDLSINSSGASDIQYRGNPANVNNNKSGASSLQKIN